MATQNFARERSNSNSNVIRPPNGMIYSPLAPMAAPKQEQFHQLILDQQNRHIGGIVSPMDPNEDRDNQTQEQNSEEFNGSVVSDLPPPDRSSSASAPPLLEPSNVFASNNRFANIFSGQFDIRASEDYYEFYKEFGLKFGKLPPPLEPAPFVFDGVEDDQHFHQQQDMLGFGRFWQNDFAGNFRNEAPDVNDQFMNQAQQKLQEMNIGRSQNMGIPFQGQTNNVWNPAPRKISRFPSEGFADESGLRIQTQKESSHPPIQSEPSYSSSPSAQTAIKAANFLFGNEEDKDHHDKNKQGDHFYDSHSTIDSSNSSNGSSPGADGSTRSNVSCRYYQAGYCSRGEKCYYSHDTPLGGNKESTKMRKNKSPRVSVNNINPVNGNTNGPTNPNTANGNPTTVNGLGNGMTLNLGSNLGNGTLNNSLNMSNGMGSSQGLQDINLRSSGGGGMSDLRNSGGIMTDLRLSNGMGPSSTPLTTVNGTPLVAPQALNPNLSPSILLSPTLHQPSILGNLNLSSLITKPAPTSVPSASPGLQSPLKSSSPQLVTMNPLDDPSLSPRSASAADGFYANFDQLIGKIYIVSKDQQGCRFLQKKLEEQDPKVVETIFNEVYDHITELMTDPFGNYLCQKLLEHCIDIQRYKIVERVAPELVTISKNMHGTRAVQKMIECLSSPDQIELIKRALSDSVVELIQDLNGNHVIQRCLHRLSAEDNNQFIYNAVTSGNNCVQVATHRHGCCVLQRCIDNASEKQKVQLIQEIIKNALTLVQDPYGNYVVQYVLDLPFPNLVEALIQSFLGHLRQLGTQKFSSNVIEKTLNVATPYTRSLMIGEILQEHTLSAMLQDPFANYVIQTALNISEPHQHQALVESIKPYLNQLRNTPYGKRIQNKITKESTDKHSKHK